MAFPYLYAASFDTGDNSEWDSESDTGALLDFPHYSALAAIAGHPMPFRGAYCMRITPGDTNDHTVLEGDIDVADTVTRWVRFALYVSTDFAATADDEFSIFQWQQAAGTVEAHVALQVTAATDLVDIGTADGTGTPATYHHLSKGRWHVIESMITVSTGGAGVVALWVDGVRLTNLTSQTHAAAVGAGVLGTQDTLATTNAGYLLFDEFAFDDTRLGLTERWGTTRLITRSCFLFVGPGRVDNLKILDGGAGDVTVELYDTDTYYSSLTPRWRDRTAVANTNLDAADVPIHFTRGCLAILGGTTPGAIVSIGRAVGWGSDAAIRSYALNRAQGFGAI
jgi:hypothetical protein